KDAVSVPVIANGDICTISDAREAMRLSGADGVMIGRGIQGAPWRLAEIAHGLGFDVAPKVPEGADFIAMVRDHYDAALSFYGESLGARVIRKHLGWYMDRAETPTSLRKKLLTGSSSEVRAGLGEALTPRALAA
ncbi:MAG: tRNA-dihydrouridine synthase, partial [Pseudomonadota bacterium]